MKRAKKKLNNVICGSASKKSQKIAITLSDSERGLEVQTIGNKESRSFEDLAMLATQSQDIFATAASLLTQLCLFQL